jgi:hypothetical protein
MPPEFREYMGAYIGGGIQLALGFFLMLFLGSMFSTLGGLLGAVIFRKQVPPGAPGTAGTPGTLGTPGTPGNDVGPTA